MPDAPDGSRYQLSGQRNTLSDMAELAVRLGSPVVYDRLGQVIFADRFDYGLNIYVTSFSGTGASVTLDTVLVEASPYSVHLVAGSTLLTMAELYKVFSPPEVNKWGLELGAALYTNFDNFRVTLYRYDGSTEYRARVRLVEATHMIQVEDNALGFVDVFDNVYSFIGQGEFSHIKLVADYDTGKYVKLLYNDHTIDLSQYTMKQTPDASLPGQVAAARLIGVAGENDQASLGHFIITVGEP